MRAAWNRGSSASGADGAQHVEVAAEPRAHGSRRARRAATRARAGGTTKPLRDASPDTRVELVGTGTQVAIAYATAGEPVVVAASRSGELTPIWQGAADGVPSIQWADGRLVIARHVGGELIGTVARVP